MPKDAEIGVETPVKVDRALRVFASPLRAQLVRYYGLHPGHSQMDAVHALQVAKRSVANNVRPLVDVGLLIETVGDDKRARAYFVDHQVRLELITALLDFTEPPAVAGQESDGPDDGPDTEGDRDEG